jgi:acyl carrier protein
MDENAISTALLEFCDFVSGHVEKELVLPETLINDLDVDSLEFIELVQAISAKYGPVPDDKITKVCTVRDLFDAIPA